MGEKNADEYLLEAMAKTTGNDELLRKFRQNPHSTLDIVRTGQGGIEVRLVKPAETFWSALLFVLIFGVGVFALIGWGIFVGYESIVSPVDDGPVLFIIRSIFFGLYVCIEFWNQKGIWNHLTPAYRAILVGLVLVVLVGGLAFDIFHGDTWGLAWNFLIVGLAVRTLFKDESE